MIVDTDIIIRFLTNDDPKKAKDFERFLNSKKKIILTDVSFAEVYWTLKSFYKFPKGEIIPALNCLQQISTGSDLKHSPNSQHKSNRCLQRSILLG